MIKRWHIRIHKRQFLVGIALVTFSFFMPLFFNVYNLGVLRSFAQAMWEQGQIELAGAALRLVALNTLRGIPHYVGAFFVGTAIEIRREQKNVWLINAALMLLILQITYKGIEVVHGIHYDYGIPAIVVSTFILLFGKLDRQYISPVKKALQVILFIAAFQFLDIMPVANHLPIGRGETSVDMKTAAALLECEMLLDIIGVTGCLMLSLFGMLVFFELRNENNLRRLASLQKINEEIKTSARISEIENRTFHEVQYLVHDLKSPLTAMQTLVGILKMSSEAQYRTQDVEYLSRIENGIVQMSRMISQILYEGQCSEITSQELLNLTLAQISVAPYAEFVRVENEAPDAIVSVNRFLFPRALVNLAQNSASAVPAGRTLEICIKINRVSRQGSEYISFCVSDNGRGIPVEHQKKIWERSISGTGSSGLGLAFVRRVVDGLGGEIMLESKVGDGTSIQILLPEEGVYEN